MFKRQFLLLIFGLFVFSSTVSAQEMGHPEISAENAAQVILLSALEGHEDAVYSVVFSPNSSLLASGGEDTMVRLWDVAATEEIAALSQHTEPIYALIFSPDGSEVVSTGRDMTVLHWDVETESYLSNSGFEADDVEFLHSFMESSLAFRGMVWLIDQPLVVGDKSLIIPTADGRVDIQMEAPDYLSVARSSDDDNLRLVIGTSDGIRFGGENNAVLEEEGTTFNSVAFSPDDMLVASGDETGTVTLWNAQSVSSFSVSSAFEDVHTDDVTGVAFSPDGTVLVSVDRDGAIILWDVEAETEITRFTTEDETPLNGIAFSPDGSYFAVAGDDGTIWLYGLEAVPVEELPEEPVTGTISSDNSVNVRSGPGTDFSVVTTAAPGTEVVILGRNEDGSWLAINVNDDEGWVATFLVTTDADIDSLPVSE